MNINSLSRIPWLPLILLWLTYNLLGWYLSAHHIVWIVGAFIVAVPLAIAWQSISWLEGLIKFSSQGLFVVLMLLSLSILFAVIATWPILLALIIMPVATTFLAEVDLRFADFNKLNTFLILTIVAGFGLGLGELIDILFLPSSRY